MIEGRFLTGEHMKNKVLAGLLSLALVISCIDVNAFAAFAATGEQEEYVFEKEQETPEPEEVELQAEPEVELVTGTEITNVTAVSDLFEYKIDGEEATITKYKGTSTVVAIPETIGEATVTAIGANAFKGTNIISVGLPETLREVGEYAFYQCEALENLNIAEGLVKTNKYSFGRCTSLTEVKLPTTLQVLGDQVFGGCTSLKKVFIPKGIQDVDLAPFRECPLETVLFDEGITELPGTKSGAVYDKVGFLGGSGLEEIVLPDTIEIIGDQAFRDCKKLKKVTFPKNLKKIEDGAFANCIALEKAIIPEGTEIVEEEAFKNCTALAEVFLPKTLQDCGFQSFDGTTALKKITFEDGITTIWGANPIYKEEGIFGGCGVEEVYLPDSVTAIEGCAFGGCTSLKSIRLSPNITSIGEKAFYDCGQLDGVYLPEGITAIAKQVFHNCASLSEIVIPENVEIIEYGAFQGCSSLGSIYIPRSVGEIEDKAFMDCTSLKAIEFEVHNLYTTEQKLGDDVFNGCTALTDIQLGNRIAKIKKGTFAGCTSLKEIQIPYGVTTVITGAFSKCNKLEILFVPSSVEIFGTTDDEFERSYNHVPLVYVEKGSSNARNYALALGWDVEVGIWNVDIEDESNEFPDKNFNNQLHEQKVDINIDTRLTLREVEACKNLEVSAKEIKDVTGLQLLTSLEALDISENRIETFFTGDENTLASLTGLKLLDCSSNKLQLIDLSNNAELTDLNCGDNMLFALDLSNNKKLSELTVGEQYPVGTMSDSDYFDNILDLKAIYGDQFSKNSVSNISDEYLKEGEEASTENEGIVWSKAYHVPDLFTYDYKVSYGMGATKTMKVTAVITNAGLTRDSEEVAAAYPDGNFRTAVFALLDSNGNEKLSRTEERMAKTLDVSGREIGSVTGIERFWSLEDLNVKNNELTAIDLGANKKLTKLQCDNNFLTALALKENTAITDLYIGGNGLAAVDIAGLTALENFRAGKQRVVLEAVTEGELNNIDIKSYDPSFDREKVFDYTTLDANDNATAKEITLTDTGFTVLSDVPFIRYNWRTDKGDMQVTVAIIGATEPVDPEPEPIPEPDPEEDEETGRDPGFKPEAESFDIYLVKGQTCTFPATYGDLDGEAENAGETIAWKSSDKNTVAVSSGNKIKAKKNTLAANAVYVYDGSSTEDSRYVYSVYVVTPKIVKIEGTTVSDYKKTDVIAGDSITLGVEGLGANEAYAGAYKISWYSSNEEIAKVTDGVVKTYAKGTAKITAYINGSAYTSQVKVVDKAAIGKIANKQHITLVPLQAEKLKFSDPGFKASGLSVFEVTEEGEMKAVPSYDSKNNSTDVKNKISYYQNSVVRITPAGKITAVGVGTTSLALADKNNNIQYITVTVTKPVTNTVYLNLGGSKTLKHYKVTAKKATWSSSDASITDGNAGAGKVKGGKPGFATVTCSYDPYGTGTPIEYKTFVIVEDPRLVADEEKLMTVTSAKGNSAKLELKVGDRYVIDDNLKYQAVIYTSTKPDVAFVNDAGVIFARAPGKTTIRTNVNGKKLTINLVVK